MDEVEGLESQEGQVQKSLGERAEVASLKKWKKANVVLMRLQELDRDKDPYSRLS